MEFNAKLRTCLWFDSKVEEAAEFYVSLLPDSRIENVLRQDPNVPPLVVEFSLAGAPYMALNGGPHFILSEVVSTSVLTEDQDETDRLWMKLLEGGGQESQCGWLKDRYGLSWQIVPKALPRLVFASDREAAGRAHAAMMRMSKIDIAALEAAYRGN